MENATAQEIVKLIKSASYSMLPHELTIFEAIESISNSGSDLEPEDALQLENLFEKIKRGGYLNP